MIHVVSGPKTDFGRPHKSTRQTGRDLDHLHHLHPVFAVMRCCARAIMEIPPLNMTYVRKTRVIQIPAIIGKLYLHRTDRIHQGSVCPERSRSCNG